MSFSFHNAWIETPFRTGEIKLYCGVLSGCVFCGVVGLKALGRGFGVGVVLED